MNINIEGLSGWILWIVIAIILFLILVLGAAVIVWGILFLIALVLDKIKVNIHTKRILLQFIINRKKIEEILKTHPELENPFKEEK